LEPKKNVIAIVLILALISTSLIGNQVFSAEPDPPVVPIGDGVWEKFGPRIDNLIFKVAGSVSAESLMLADGEIDLMEWAAPGTEWEDWLADSEITMGEYMELSAIYIAPNHARWPCGHGEQKPSGFEWSHFGGEVAYTCNHDLSDWPQYLEDSAVDTGGTGDTYFVDPDCQRCLDARQFRRALAHLVNRDPIIAHMRGTGIAMESLILPPITGAWENETAKMGTLYPFGLANAEAALAAGGFKDYDDDGWFEYSPSHAPGWDPGEAPPADMEELPSLEVYIRQDDPDRIFAGTFFTQQMELLGIPNTPIITSNVICSQHVWQYPYDYDIYIEYWDWGVPLPDIYYEGFHSSKDTYPASFADNSIRYHDHEFDAFAEEFLTSLTPAAAVDPCKGMQGIAGRDAVVIPLYDYTGYSGPHRTNYGVFPGEATYAGLEWEGFNNEPGLGFYSLWSMLNAHPEGFERGGTFRHGLVNDITDFNIHRTWWTYDLQILWQIYEGLTVVNPENQTEYIPWLAESVTPGTWDKPGYGPASAFNVTLIPGILWQDATPTNPWTLTIEDVGFSFEYNRDHVTINYWAVKDFEEYVTYDTDPGIPGDETIELRFSILSWLAQDWVSGIPIIPKHIWEGKDPWAWDPSTEDALIGTGPFIFAGDDVVGRVDRVPGQFVYMKPNPTYFRRLVRPDFYPDDEPNPWGADGTIDLDDFMTAVGQFGLTSAFWHPTWGPRADVNKDGKVLAIDLTEIAVRFGQSGFIDGYPSYYT
jgi:hypothetical protein